MHDLLFRHGSTHARIADETQTARDHNKKLNQSQKR